jgi:hypothetical protein
MNSKLNPNRVPKSGALGRRLAKHFAALAIPAVLVPAAQAQIVWSGPVNINVPSNIDGVYMNVLTGVTGTSGGAVAGWDINPYTAGAGPLGCPSGHRTSLPAVLSGVWETRPTGWTTLRLAR